MLQRGPVTAERAGHLRLFAAQAASKETLLLVERTLDVWQVPSTAEIRVALSSLLDVARTGVQRACAVGNDIDQLDDVYAESTEVALVAVAYEIAHQRPVPVEAGER